MAYAYKKVSVGGMKIDEHRYIMERYLNRKLSFNEVIHHKDGNKRNNDISNLELMTRAEHNRLHNVGRPLSEEHRKKLSDAQIGISKPKKRSLNENQIIEILNMHQSGLSSRKIAVVFDVNKSTILSIIKEELYRRVTQM